MYRVRSRSRIFLITAGISRNSSGTIIRTNCQISFDSAQRDKQLAATCSFLVVVDGVTQRHNNKFVACGVAQRRSHMMLAWSLNDWLRIKAFFAFHCSKIFVVSAINFTKRH